MKKTKKANVITVLALTVVMLAAMTGLAAADPATVNIADDPIINPLDGSTVTSSTLTVTILDKNAGDRFISVKTTKANLLANITGGPSNIDTGWTSTIRAGEDWTTLSGGTYTFTIHVKGTEDGQVTVYDNEGNQYYEAGSGFDEAACTRDVLIPEFATIAIPVAAILGLVLFFNHRKRKKE